MDSLELLAREDEFKKLNKQLEKKTESLMKEIEHVMQKPDFFSEFSHNLTLSPQHTAIKKHCCDTPKISTPEQSTPSKTKPVKTPKKSPKNIEKSVITEQNLEKDDTLHNCARSDGNCTKTISSCANSVRTVCDCCAMSRSDRINEDLGFLYAFVSVNVQEKVLPQSFLKDRATVENVCKFLSSKIKLMQEQMDKLQGTINKKALQCEAHLTQQAELESERMSLLNKSNNLAANAADAKAKCMTLQKKLDEKDRLYKEQRSETDKLTSEVKRLRSKTASAEARCAMQEETIDTLRHQLELARKTEKEFRDSTRSLSASHETAISRLESRCKQLTTRVDKQASLVDNLRKQNALLSAAGSLNALEREYSAFLTQDT